MIDLIVSDMDGTLLNKEGEISNKNIEIISKIQKEGIIFAIASGRALTEALPALKKAKIQCPILTGNGAQGFDEHHNNFFTYDINKNVAKKIIDLLEKHNIYFEVATTQDVFSTNEEQRMIEGCKHIKSLNPNLKDEEIKKITKAHMQKLAVNFIDSFNYLLANDDLQILKFLAVSEEGQKVLKPLQDIIETFDNVHVTSSFHNNIEVNSAKATKGNAVKELATKYKISLDKTLVLGDNYNDESMFAVAGYSAAMHNAVPELKEMATYISDAHDADGVANAIKHFLN